MAEATRREGWAGTRGVAARGGLAQVANVTPVRAARGAPAIRVHVARAVPVAREAQAATHAARTLTWIVARTLAWIIATTVPVEGAVQRAMLKPV